MKLTKLTCCVRSAHSHCMKRGKRKRATMALMLGTFALAGCISVEAPDEPIVIELNINITQEVIYRLADAADELIEENADIF